MAAAGQSFGGVDGAGGGFGGGQVVAAAPSMVSAGEQGLGGRGGRGHLLTPLTINQAVIIQPLTASKHRTRVND